MTTFAPTFAQMIFLGRGLNNHSAPNDYLIPVPEKSFRMLDVAKIAPSQIDYAGIGDTMVAT
jgi:hypothetical protein